MLKCNILSDIFNMLFVVVDVDFRLVDNTGGYIQGCVTVFSV